jgi:hypothetical protein
MALALAGRLIAGRPKKKARKKRRLLGWRS